MTPSGIAMTDSEQPTLTHSDRPGLPAESGGREAPAAIGAYRVVRLLGEGGMGIVWEAEQAHTHRPVAVKVMRQAPFADPVVARLFEREVEILGRLKHPGIAEIYEAGRTEGGHAYFAMELVRGSTLDRWLSSRPVPMTREEVRLRLKTFQLLCEAVNYAHQRGVIHRDLKPSNIVVLDDGIKVLDFGIARLADAEARSGAAVLTQTGIVRGTPAYMSPEQALGEATGLDVRMDVYALGVILYEMLTGKRPHDVDGLSLTKAARIISETPPHPLSAAWTGPFRLDPDLETIVGKALQRDPERRYPSAAALSEDIERSLTSQPIVARRPSRAYRARKFLARHRLGAFAVASAALLLVAFAANMTLQARSIARERDRANREAEAFRRVAGFMTDMFKVADPSEARGNSVTAREILDQASRRIDTGLAQDPALQARLLWTMGNVYRGLGLYSQAETLLKRAADTEDRVHGSEDPEALRARMDLVVVTAQQGRYGEAETLGSKVLDVQRRVLKPGDPGLVTALNTVAITAYEQGHYQRAEALYREELDLARRLHGQDSLEVATALNNLGLVDMDEGKDAEAEKEFREALTVRQRVSGSDHPDTLKMMLNVAISCEHQGHYEEAERLGRETLDLRRRVLGPDHPDTLESMRLLAGVAYEAGDFAAAAKRHEEALAGYSKTLGPEHPETLQTMNDLANDYDTAGRHAEAVALYRKTIAARRRVLGPDHEDTLHAQVDLAEALRAMGRLDESATVLEETLATQRRVLPPVHPDIGLTLYNLACTEAKRGHHDQSLDALEQALDHGLRPVEAAKIPGETDLQSLRGDARFDAIVAKAKRPPA